MNRPERAARADAAEILALYRAAARAANQSGHSHWDEDYPNRETIAKTSKTAISTSGARTAKSSPPSPTCTPTTSTASAFPGRRSSAP